MRGIDRFERSNVEESTRRKGTVDKGGIILGGDRRGWRNAGTGAEEAIQLLSGYILLDMPDLNLCFLGRSERGARTGVD